MRVLLMVVGLVIGAAAPAFAQEMPAWAAPQDTPEARTSEPEEDGAQQASGGPFQCDRANPNCIDIDPAPVDGGLALLALLGTGYAVHRLRRDSDGD